MNINYQFLLTNGEKQNIPVGLNVKARNGALATADGIAIPQGSTGATSLIEFPFMLDASEMYEGQEFEMTIGVKITNYSALQTLPTVITQKIKNGEAYVYSTPTELSYRDYEASVSNYRVFKVKQRVTNSDLQLGYTLCFAVQLLNWGAVTQNVQMSILESEMIAERPKLTKPIYKDDLSLDWEYETNERFYRGKLTGKLSFVRDDYEYIHNTRYGNVFRLFLRKSKDNGKTYTNYHTSKFMHTDCTINEDDKIVVVQPEARDQYNEVLAGMEKEYDMIKIAPSTENVTYYKRPLIQIYVPGYEKIANFLNGMTFEKEVNDYEGSLEQFHFVRNTQYIEIICGGGIEDARGVYIANVSREWRTGTAILSQQTGQYRIELTITQEALHYTVEIEHYRNSDGHRLLRVVGQYDEYPTEYNIHWYEGKLKGVYARQLCDVDSIAGVNTYPIPENDIVENSSNYRRVLGYGVDVVTASQYFTSKPNQYGKASNGLYYAPPYDITGTKYYPLAPSTWGNSSLWFNYSYLDVNIERDGRKQIQLRNAHPLADVISALLKELAPNITHNGTAEYSQFLYGATNPITGQYFRLLVTQKTNILKSEYDNPAQKAPITLRQITNMLKNVYGCYWYIEDNKFKIEHISWFKNGGTYTGTPTVGIDLTSLTNVRNGKKWAFGTSEYSYDKQQMPERYEYEWMDDASEFFNGYPIDVLSASVQEGKIEKTNIANFSSDIDLMLLNPSEFSNDGLALMAVVQGKNGYELPFVEVQQELSTYYVQNGYASMLYAISHFLLYDMPSEELMINNKYANADGTMRIKKQTLQFPIGEDEPNLRQLVRTNIGNGEIEKISINLSSRSAKTTLRYEAE